MAVPIANPETSFITLRIGVLVTAAFVIITSFIAWLDLKYTIGIRVGEEEEMLG